MVAEPSAMEKEKVLAALENPKYFWRTIQGLSDETGLAVDVINAAIKKHYGTVVKSTIPSDKGESLYTTRTHFRKKASFGEKLSGAFKNRLGGST